MLAIGCLLGQSQSADQLLRRGAALAAFLGVCSLALLERNADSVGAHPGGLPGHVRHGAPLGGEEIDVTDRLGFQSLGVDHQDRIAVGRAGEASGPWTRRRHIATRLVEQRPRLGVRRLRGGSDRQVERELAFLGDADVVTHQPFGRRGERQCAPDNQISRGRDAHQQQHVVAEAIVDDSADIDQRRRRPHDGVGCGAGRQGPFDLGWQARIAGVLPVGVPLRPDGLAQRYPERLAGLHSRDFGNQLCPDVLGLHHALGVA